MQIDILTEEPSAKAALDVLLPKILPASVTFLVSNFNGKPDLLKKLPNRLHAYARRIGHEDLKVCVLVDRDSQDCRMLKRELEMIAEQAGLVTKSVSKGEVFHVLNRIVVEELEAWFFGDPDALRRAYPGWGAISSRRHDTGGRMKSAVELPKRWNVCCEGANTSRETCRR